MNKIFLGLGILATSMAMVSCSQDDFDNTVNNPTDDGSRFYTQLTISLPTAGGRADETLQEVGQEGENTIKKLNIILMDKQSDGSYEFIAETGVTSVTSPSSAKPIYQAIFQGSDIKTIYTQDRTEYTLSMFVVANYPENTIGRNFDPATFTFDSQKLFGYNEYNQIIMTGAPYDVKLPSTSAELMQYDNNSRPYNLTANGPVNVERSIARFDYKSVKANDVYDILDITKENVIGKIQLLDMAVVNERTSAYLFGRSSDNGQNSDFNFGLVANNPSKQFVVSPLADALGQRQFFGKFATKVTDASAFDQESGYFWTKISDLTGSQDDNDDSWNEGNKYGAYKIWRYVNENTIPSIKEQTWENSTGVIFRANILNNGDKIPGYGNGSLYLFQNVLYGNFAALKEAATKTEGGVIVNPVLNHYFKATWGENAANADETTFVDNQTPAKNGFTVYENEGTPDAPKYYTYYYYWNRHEDNGRPNDMGAMEFAVVRNNVYKLAVNSINRFGHTTDPDNDPDPVDPKDPDENEDIYFKVDVTVLPWTVRVNNIDF